MPFRSLAVYIYYAKRHGVSYEQCLEAAHNYKNFLASYAENINLEQVKFYWGIECLPLSSLEITPKDYCSIARQIFSGTLPAQIEKPFDSPAEEAVQAIIGRMNTLLATKENTRKRISGLVVGRVQSGKTSNYIRLLLNAIHESWNVILVLTSNNAALGRQTFQRLQENIDKSKETSNAVQLNYLQNDNIVFDKSKYVQAIGNGKFYWGVVLKETNHLDNVFDWLGKNKDSIPQMNLLVIDDEADNASVDATPQSKLWTEEQTRDFIEEIPDDNQLLKEWLSSLFNLELSGEQRNCLDGCMSHGNAGDIMDRLLRSPEINEILSLSNYTDSEGELHDLSLAIRNFFNNQRGAGNLHAKSSFVRVLRSIFSIVQTSSAINSKIRQLIAMRDCADDYEYPFARCAYIGYTATPYACIFNRPANDTPLYPDFIYSLPKADGYFGLDEIFGSNMEMPEPRMPIVTVITEEDSSALQKIENSEQCESFDSLEPKADTLYLSHNTLQYLLNGNHNVPKECEQLKIAIAWAFCSAAARRYYRRFSKADDNSREACFTTMLINLSSRKNYHKKLQEIIQSYVNFQCAVEQREHFIEFCHETWRTQTEKLTSTHFKNLFDYSPQEYPDWKDIQGDLLWFINGNCQVIQINSTPEGKYGQQRYEDGGETKDAQTKRKDTLWIVCGGNTISRGLTLAGLCVSFFDRVNRLTAVDTYIQMGRWFGYRDGYELLPRIWMPVETIREYKKAATVEEHIHRDLKTAFADHISPSEGENFPTVLYWGRKLSGRAYSMRRLTSRLETSFVINDINIDNASVQAVADIIRRFLCSLDKKGKRFDNRNAYEDYVKFPVWSQIPPLVIRDFISELIDWYPESSKRILRGLIQEINREEYDLQWDVVLGTKHSPRKEQNMEFNIWSQYWTSAGNPIPSIDTTRSVATFCNARSIAAYYAMIDQKYLNDVDADILRYFKETIIAHILDKQKFSKEHIIPKGIDEILPPGQTIAERLEAYISKLKGDLTQPMAHSMHGLLLENQNTANYANRSCRDYRKKVYEKAEINHPVLQIYPIKPLEEIELQGDKLLFSLSFYWPNHSPVLFTQVTVGFPQVCPVSTIEFYHAIQDILMEYDFVMPRKMLCDRIVNDKLVGRCNINFFNENIASGVGTRYRQFKRELYNGNQYGYYALTWAENDTVAQKRFKTAIQDKVYEILSQHPQREFSRDELLNLVCLDTRFDTFLHLAGQPTDKQYFDEKIMAGLIENSDNVVMVRRQWIPCYKIIQGE